MSKKKFCALLLPVLFFPNIVLSQNSIIDLEPGEWYIPPSAPSYITPGYLDSLVLVPIDPVNPPGHQIGQDSIGKPMWISDILICIDSANIRNSVNYICAEKYWVKAGLQYNCQTGVIYNDTVITSTDSTGSEFWTEDIMVTIVDSTEIIVNSQVDATAKIYDAYDVVNPAFAEFNIIGNETDQRIQFSTSSGFKYIVVFYEDQNTIVDVKIING